MIRRMAFVGAGALVLLAGCATHWDVDSFEAPGGNVASRHTYFWRGGDFGSPGAFDPAVVALASTQLRGAVTAELNRKGFKEVDTAAAADMIVSFQVAGSQHFVLSDDRRIGAPSATTVLSPSASQPPPAPAGSRVVPLFVPESQLAGSECGAAFSGLALSSCEDPYPPGRRR